MLSISAIVPTYNGAAFLEDALKSLFAQTVKPCEIIVVDDASADDTLKVARTIGARSPVPFRTLALPENSGGPARPINAGIEQAQGTLVAVLDQDDLFLPQRLEVMGTLLDRRPDVSLAFSECGVVNAPGVRPLCQVPRILEEIREFSTKEEGAYVLDGSALLARLILHFNFVVGFPGFLFRKVDWARKGGLDESFRIAADYEFLCWLCLHGRAFYLPSTLYLRRIHDVNLSQGTLEPWIEIARVIVRYIGQTDTCDSKFSENVARMYRKFLVVLASAGAADRAFRLLRDGPRDRHRTLDLLRASRPLLSAWLRAQVTGPRATDACEKQAQLQGLVERIAATRFRGRDAQACPPGLCY